MNLEASNKIRFHFLSEKFHFQNRNRLKSFLLRQIKKEGKAVEAINYIFCNDKYLLEINQEYLAHDNYTDIITFQLSPQKQPLLSDIYISIERVKENARVFKTSFKKELHRVIFHGALHLCGYQDKTKEQSQQIRNKEGMLLNQYFVSRKTVSY